jgi:hypothetical protein
MRTAALLLTSITLAAAVDQAADPDVVTYMGGPQRTGWFAHEDRLAPAAVAGAAFGQLWKSEELDAYAGKAAHLYAAPLYLDALKIATPTTTGTFHAVIAATSNAWVYAINAQMEGTHQPGAILWRTSLGKPAHATDGGVPMGVLGTPLIVREAGCVYVSAATDGAEGKGWKLYALSLSDGQILPGWPVAITNDALSQPGINGNGTSAMGPHGQVSQRGALNRSPDGRLVYISFGAYGDGVPGWMVAVDTAQKRIAAAFSGGQGPERNNGGIWSSAGPTVDADGSVFGVTGNGPIGAKDRTGTWGQSLLKWAPPGKDGLVLSGTYTPFNYDAADKADIDLGSSAAILIPALDAAQTSTPLLAVIAGKQGNIYLIDRQHLPGSLERRPPPSKDSTTDGSLLPPEPQPQFSARGPLNVFGPYSDLLGNMDYARSRSTPAYFRTADGAHHLVATGTTKSNPGATDSIPPCVARLRIVTAPGRPAHLAVDAVEKTLSLTNPGCPVVSSNGGTDAVIWVLDMPQRTKPLVSDKTPRPTLYAIDAQTMKPLWHSGDAELGQGGKYTAASIARGMVLVGTDRVYAFGVKK